MRRRLRLAPSLLAAPLLALGLAAGAQAQNYAFSCVTNNSAANCATGMAQFGLSLTQGVGYVDFLFTNQGAAASSITDIYFDWLNPAQTYAQGTITSGPGVSFSWGATPPNLPGASNLNPNFTADLAADSNSPTQHNGVNPGEWVSFRFLTGSTTTAADLYSGALRVGLHAQGFANGGSDSFVTVASPAPEPETIAMMLAGLVGIGAKLRRRRSA
ncbi:MAG: PEP-CTERM sorting domain-containing protein [Piscinibacter sp.]|nr:PEP-CTERM sorting domain-containing protein [Piscinibacter sp.]